MGATWQKRGELERGIVARLGRQRAPRLWPATATGGDGQNGRDRDD